MLAADYPFMDILWTMLIFFAWIGGGGKTLWIIFAILTPFLGVFVYLISQGKGMAERNMKSMQAAQAHQADYIKSVAGGGAADEIDKAKKLLDSGAITQAEYDSIKAKALAS